MKNVMKKLLAISLTVAMTASLAACGGAGAAAPAADAAAPAADAAAPAAEAAAPAADGKVKIGVSIWSSTDVLGSQCKLILDEAAKAIGADIQYVDQGPVSEPITATKEQLAAAGCQGLIICT